LLNSTSRKLLHIVIDHDHGLDDHEQGRYDPGAVNSCLTEADVVLEVGLTLKHYLTQAKNPVWVTRYDDITTPARSQPTSRGRSSGAVRTPSRSTAIALPIRRPTEQRPSMPMPPACRWYDPCKAQRLQPGWLRDGGIKRHCSLAFPGELTVLDERIPSGLLEIGLLSHWRDRRRMVGVEGQHRQNESHCGWSGR